MFLSRIAMDTNRRETLRALASPQIIHAVLEKFCPNDSNAGSMRKIWRIDRLKGRLYLLVLSPNEPDLSGIIEQFGSSGTAAEIKNYGGLLSRIQVGQAWQFRLCANPVHCVREGQESKRRGKIYAHVTIDQQKEWLRKRAAACGVSFLLGEAGSYVDGFDVVESGTIRFRRKDRSVTLGVATFEGKLQVTDADLFKKALVGGIGRAKAYGCGLMTVARLL